MTRQFFDVHIRGVRLAELVILLPHLRPLRRKTHFDYLSLPSLSPFARSSWLYPTNGISRLLDISLTRGDKCIQCGWGIRPCPLFGLMPNSFPPVEALEFDTSLILVSLLYGLKNYDIVGSALPVRRSLWSQES
jgi:hypothetical protein